MCWIRTKSWWSSSGWTRTALGHTLKIRGFQHFHTKLEIADFIHSFHSLTNWQSFTRLTEFSLVSTYHSSCCRWVRFWKWSTAIKGKRQCREGLQVQVTDFRNVYLIIQITCLVRPSEMPAAASSRDAEASEAHFMNSVIAAFVLKQSLNSKGATCPFVLKVDKILDLSQ